MGYSKLCSMSVMPVPSALDRYGPSFIVSVNVLSDIKNIITMLKSPLLPQANIRDEDMLIVYEWLCIQYPILSFDRSVNILIHYACLHMEHSFACLLTMLCGGDDFIFVSAADAATSLLICIKRDRTMIIGRNVCQNKNLFI